MIGLSLVNMPINTWGINALENRVIAHGTAIANTFRQVAGSLGTAVLITVMSIVVASSIDRPLSLRKFMGSTWLIWRSDNDVRRPYPDIHLCKRREISFVFSASKKPQKIIVLAMIFCGFSW